MFYFLERIYFDTCAILTPILCLFQRILSIKAEEGSSERYLRHISSIVIAGVWEEVTAVKVGRAGVKFNYNAEVSGVVAEPASPSEVLCHIIVVACIVLLTYLQVGVLEISDLLITTGLGATTVSWQGTHNIVTL